MEYKTVSTLIDGAVLAKPIYDTSNRLLLNKGAVIGENQKQILTKFGIHGVYVETSLSLDADLMNDDFETSCTGLNKSAFTEFNIKVHFFLPTEEAQVIEQVEKRVKTVCNSLGQFAESTVINASCHELKAINIHEFKRKIPKEFQYARGALSFYSMELDLLVFSGDGGAFVPDKNEEFWYKHEELILCMNVLKTANKVEECNDSVQNSLITLHKVLVC